MPVFRYTFLLILPGLILFNCQTQKKQKVEKLSQEMVQDVISDFETTAKKYEEPANAAIQQLIESMGSDFDSLKTKDFSHLKSLAEQAEQTCIEASMRFKHDGTNLSESLPDTVRYSLTTITALLHDAYLSRAYAMRSAKLLFSDSLEIHLSEFSQKLEMAAQLSDQAALGLMTVKRLVQSNR